jgi:hypothetical protein
LNQSLTHLLIVILINSEGVTSANLFYDCYLFYCIFQQQLMKVINLQVTDFKFNISILCFN